MKFFIWFSILIILGIIIYLFSYSTPNNQYDIYASYLGIAITILAFGITLHQIIIVKEQNKKIEEETRTVAKETSKKIKSLLTIADISDTINKLQSIQQNLTANKIELALYQMQEINKILLEIQMDASYQSIIRSNLKSLMSAYSSDISSLQDTITNQPQTEVICLSPIIKDVHQIEENIILVRNHLKQKAYE